MTERKISMILTNQEIFRIAMILIMAIIAILVIRNQLIEVVEKAAKEKRIADLDAEKRHKNISGDLFKNVNITYSDIFKAKASRLVSCGYKPVAYLNTDFSYREIHYIKGKEEKYFVFFEQKDSGEIFLKDII